MYSDYLNLFYDALFNKQTAPVCFLEDAENAQRKVLL